ncbi:MAG: hypothetical protein JSU86_07345 [Phycisphaerales bacterium]|nr:MAG: hypothetical protein JSU86_07345 [Phycisphaerales bacterium]
MPGSGGGDWAGRLEGVAIYSRFFEAQEAQQHYGAYLARLGENRPVKRWTVAAVLLRKVSIPEPKLYPQTLVAYEYELRTPSVESFKVVRFLVVHWGALNGAIQTEVRDLHVGRTYRMTLERFDDHPQLRTIKLVTQRVALDLPLFYTIGDGLSGMDKTTQR